MNTSVLPLSQQSSQPFLYSSVFLAIRLNSPIVPRFFSCLPPYLLRKVKGGMMFVCQLNRLTLLLKSSTRNLTLRRIDYSDRLLDIHSG